MIFDTTKNLKLYSEFNPAFAAIADFIKDNDLKSMECGSYDVAEGKQLYTNVVVYSTEPVIVETPEESIPEDGGDVSEDVSEDASEEDESEVGGNDFNAGDKEDGNKEGGNNTLIITICICAAIAVVIAVVVVIVLKKKKN